MISRGWWNVFLLVENVRIQNKREGVWREEMFVKNGDLLIG